MGGQKFFGGSSIITKRKCVEILMGFCWKLLEINKFLYFDDAHNAWITASELKDGQFWSDFHEIKTKRLIFLCCTFLDLRVLDLKFSLHLIAQCSDGFTSMERLVYPT